MDRAASYKCMNCLAEGISKDGDAVAADPERLERMRRANEARDRVAIQRREQTALEIWRSSKDGKGTLAEKYFRIRGLDVPEFAWKKIRFLPASKFGTLGGMVLPCIVLPFSDLDEPWRLVGVQRIALTKDGEGYRHNGSKVKVSNGAIMGRGAIMLQRETDSLCICEGFETALGVMMTGKNEGAPVWATTGSEFLAAIPPMEGVTRLVIAADNDESRAGQKAANRLSHAWRRFRDVTVITNTPPKKNSDWADAQYREA
jgi:hypothetical protein